MSEDVEEMNVQSGKQTMDNNLNKSLPYVQVSLLGSFRFEWLVPGRDEIDAWLSRTSARSLFKLLLCAPDRQATRSQLAGALWPETDEERARESLRSAIKVLRSVLYPQHEDNLLQSLPGEVLKKLNPTALHHEKAKTLLRFGKIEEARRELNRAWETLQPNLFTWHMNMHLTQATLSLAQHEIEESAKSSHKAYVLAKTIHSHKGVVEVRRLLERLQQCDEVNSCVRDLGRTLRGDA